MVEKRTIVDDAEEKPPVSKKAKVDAEAAVAVQKTKKVPKVPKNSASKVGVDEKGLLSTGTQKKTKLNVVAGIKKVKKEVVSSLKGKVKVGNAELVTEKKVIPAKKNKGKPGEGNGPSEKKGEVSTSFYSTRIQKKN